MNNYQRQATFRKILVDNLAGTDFDPVTVFQQAQPTQQGLPTTNWIAFYSLPEQAISTGGLSYVFDDVTEMFTVTQAISKAGEIQFTGRVYFKGTSQLEYTSLDLMSYCYALLHRYDITESLMQQGINIYGMEDVRPQMVLNDRDQYAMECLFNVKYQYNEVITYQVNSLSQVTGTLQDIDLWQ